MYQNDNQQTSSNVSENKQKPIGIGGTGEQDSLDQMQ